MKTLAKLLCTTIVCVLLFSCEQEELSVNSTISIEEDIQDITEESIITYFDPILQEVVEFHSADEVNKYFANTEYASIVENKMKVYETEREYVETHKLYDLAEDDELVVEYLRRFDNQDGSSPVVENAIGGYLYDGSFSSGARLSSTSTPVPSMRRSYRNRASSVKGGVTSGTILLFNRTWYRGTSELVLVAPFLNTNINNLNDRSESFL